MEMIALVIRPSRSEQQGEMLQKRPEWLEEDTQGIWDVQRIIRSSHFAKRMGDLLQKNSRIADMSTRKFEW